MRNRKFSCFVCTQVSCCVSCTPEFVKDMLYFPWQAVCCHNRATAPYLTTVQSCATLSHGCPIIRHLISWLSNHTPPYLPVQSYAPPHHLMAPHRWNFVSYHCPSVDLSQVMTATQRLTSCHRTSHTFVNDYYVSFIRCYGVGYCFALCHLAHSLHCVNNW